MNVNAVMQSKPFDIQEVISDKSNISNTKLFRNDLMKIQSKMQAAIERNDSATDQVDSGCIKVLKSVLSQGAAGISEIEGSNTDLKEDAQDLIMSVLAQAFTNIESFKTDEQTKQFIANSLENMGMDSHELLSEGKFIEFALGLRNQMSEQEFSKINISSLKDQVMELSKMFPQVFQEALEDTQFPQNELLYGQEENSKERSLIEVDSLTKNEMLETQESTISETLKENEGTYINNQIENFDIKQAPQNVFITPLNKIIETTHLIQGVKETVLHRTNAEGHIEKLEIFSQIVQKMEVSKLLNKQELIMQLYPKELGKIAVKISEENGSIFATLKVKSEEVKEDLLKNSQKLIEGLQSKGLEVKAFSVDVESGESKNNQQMQKERQKSSKRIAEIIQGIENSVNQSISSVSNQTEVNVQV